MGNGRIEIRREYYEDLMPPRPGEALKPKAPRFYSVGLLGQVEPERALNLARKYLKRI